VARCFEPPVAAEFVSGKLAEERFAEVLAHAASCDRCRDLLQEAARPQRELSISGLEEIQERLTGWRAARRAPLLPEAPLRKGDTVDRYVIIRSVGATEDGMIYEAFDPDREQRVVVKQLDVRVEDAAAVGLMAVARRLCRFSHPNVLQMLAVGAHAGAVYLVYEFVKGSPLSQLATVDARTMLTMFAQAGRGLAAAHDIGISHGCFSASTCVVDREGRVKVLDFGVGEARIRRIAAASAQFDKDWPTTGLGASDVSSEDSFIGFVPTRRAPTAPFESLILAAGPNSLGPRRYAAPELIQGMSPSPASDQFAFCAALFHHLYKRPAFAGESIALWLREVLRGHLVAPAAQPDVPRNLFAVLRRGLQHDPNARFDRMTTLLAKLPTARPLSQRGVRTAVVFAVGAAAVTGVMVARGQRGAGASSRASDCDSATRLQWQALRRNERNVLAGAGFADAPAIKDHLGAWTNSWQHATQDFCSAPLPRSPLPGAEQRVRVCEGVARDTLEDLLQLLTGAGRDRLDRAAAAVAVLPSAEQCALSAASPAWPAVVTKAEVRRQLGMLTEAAELLDNAPDGETLPELLWVRGQIAADRGEMIEARRTLETAAFKALAAGDIALSLAAATRRLSLACAAPERLLWRGFFDAQVALTPQVAPPSHLWKSALAASLSCEGDVVTAARLRDEVARSLLRDNSPAGAEAAQANAQALIEQGDSVGAEAAAQRAVEIYQSAWGPHHPATQAAQLTVAEARLGHPVSVAAAEPLIDQVASDAAARGDADAVRARASMLRARIAGQRGQVKLSLDGARKAVLEYEAALGGAHPELAWAVLELGDALLDTGRDAEAEASYRQVTGILDSLGQGQSPQLGHARAGIQLARWGAQPPRDAGELLRWGLTPTGGDLDPRLDAWLSAQLARRFAARGDDERAELHYRRALTASEQAADPIGIANAAAQLAMFAAELGRGDAQELVERALARSAVGGAAVRPRLQAALVKLLWAIDRPRARALAEQALAGLGESSADAAEVRQWIKRHDGSR
jgi:eukaryotic-like serine/threonine-protein kinase